MNRTDKELRELFHALEEAEIISEEQMAEELSRFQMALNVDDVPAHEQTHEAAAGASGNGPSGRTRMPGS